MALITKKQELKPQQPPQSMIQVSSNEAPAPKKGSDNQLTLVQAQYRSSKVSNVAYDVQLSLPKGAQYFGKAAISFTLVKVPSGNEEPIFFDFFGTDVANLIINDKSVPSLAVGNYFRDGKIVLDSNMLKVGHNMVTLELINNYRDDGYGLHSFTDKVDLNQYLYT